MAWMALARVEDWSAHLEFTNGGKPLPPISEQLQKLGEFQVAYAAHWDSICFMAAMVVVWPGLWILFGCRDGDQAQRRSFYYQIVMGLTLAAVVILGFISVMAPFRVILVGMVPMAPESGNSLPVQAALILVMVILSIVLGIKILRVQKAPTE